RRASPEFGEGGAMSWLLHNVVADLYGPYFLAFYAMAIVGVIVACFKSVRSVDQTRDLDPPEIPSKLNPYEVAYLRGGENEVTRVAIASLIRRGVLRITEGKRWLSTIKVIDRSHRPVAGELDPIEACVMKWTKFPAQPEVFFGPRGVSSMVAAACAGYEAKLAESDLLAPPEMKAAGIRLWLSGSATLLALARVQLA